MMNDLNEYEMNKYEILDPQDAKYYYIRANSPEEACKKLNKEFNRCFVKEIMLNGKIHYFDPKSDLDGAWQDFKKTLAPYWNWFKKNAFVISFILNCLMFVIIYILLILLFYR
jgi:hypothetical protein